MSTVAVAVGTPTVTLVPRVVGDVVAGQIFRVDLTVTGLSQLEMDALRAVTAEINFDASKVTFVEAQKGSLLDTQTPQVSQPATGQVSVTVGAFGTSGPFISSGAAFSLVFQAVQNTSGTALFSIAPFTPQITQTAAGVDVIYDDNGSQAVYPSPTVDNGPGVNVVAGGTVSGNVVLQGRSTVSGVSVAIQSGGVTVATATPDGTGAFSADLLPGHYSMVVTPTGVPHVGRKIQDLEVRLNEVTPFPSFLLKAGDISGDSKVMNDDLIQMGVHWRNTVSASPTSAIADLDGDGVVYGLDLALLARNWQHDGTTVVEGTRSLDAFDQNLNKRILTAAGITGITDAVAEAQEAERTLRTGGHTLDAAKLAIIAEVVTSLRRHGIFGELLDDNVTISGLINSTNTANAIAEASSIVTAQFAHLDPVDFRDLDNELAKFSSSTTPDVLDIALRAEQLVPYLQGKMTQDLFIGAYIWANNSPALQDQMCGYLGQPSGCEVNLADDTSWSIVKTQLYGDLSGAQWWTTINYGIEFTKGKNP